MIISTRESMKTRQSVLELGVSQISGASKPVLEAMINLRMRTTTRHSLILMTIERWMKS